MSFAVGYAEPIRYPERDPTALDSVLEALRGTSKGRLPYPEPLKDHTQSEDDVCDSKFIGDLHHLTSSLGFSDQVSFYDDYRHSNIFAEEEEESSPERGTVSQYLGYAGATEEEDAEEHDALGDVISCDGGTQEEGTPEQEGLQRVESLLSLMQIDQSLPAVLSRVQQYQAAYVRRVAAIHQQTVLQLQACRQQQQQDKKVHDEQLQQQQHQLQQALDQHSHKLIASKAEEAERRKAELLAELESEQQQQQEQEAAALRAAEQQEREHKQSERQQLVTGLKQSYEQFSSALDQVLAQIKECDGVELPADTTSELNSTLQHGNELLQLASTADTQQPEPGQLQQATDRLAQGLSVLDDIRGILDTRRSESEPSRSSSTASTVTVGGGAGDSGGGYSQASSLASDNPSSESALAQALETYSQLSEVHRNVAAMCADLATQNSEARSQLSRALAIVNQFNNDNASSNRQKLHQLINLVSGSVCDAGGVQVSVGDKQGPMAMFVKEQLASKLISLAHDKQVSSQAVYASLMLRLWQVDPLVQHLCLFHLYKTCPYLVPYLPVREDYSTEEEYHRALGYRHKDGGQRESLDGYLKRMNSAGQLFGRLISIQVDGSPLGLQLGWQLLSRLLVSQAQSAVTCTVLHGFLSTAGAALAKLYGSQFHKLMALMGERFVPLLEEVTKEGGEADLASFKALLGGYFSTRTLHPPPEGYRALL